MNMTPEQTAQWLDACQALLDGEPIEFLCSTGQWDDTTSVTNNYPHRRKPKPDPLAEVKAAYAAGRKIEYRTYDGQWGRLLEPSWRGEPSNYRIAPEPRMVPLEACDVPPGSALSDYSTGHRYRMIVGVGEGGITTTGTYEGFETIRNKFIFRPGDTEWRRCEKEERP